jgi:hypothetical protein
MKKLLSMLIAATFAAVSYQAIAAEETPATPKVEKKVTTKKKHAKKKVAKKVAKKEVNKEVMKK